MVDANEFLDKDKSEKIEIIKQAIGRLTKMHPRQRGFDSFEIAREIIVAGQENKLPENLHWQMKRVARSITSLLPTTKYEIWKGNGIGWHVSDMANHPSSYYLQ